MKVNRYMQSLMSSANIAIPIRVKNLAWPLLNFIGSGFIESEMCIFFREAWNKMPHLNLAQFEDRTAFECFVNKIYIDDLLKDQDYTEMEKVRETIWFAKEVQDLLKAAFEGRIFEVFLSINNYQYICNFHEIRLGETWLSDDLESYSEEAILIMD